MLAETVVVLLLWELSVAVYVTVTEAAPVADERKLSVQLATPRVVVGESWH